MPLTTTTFLLLVFIAFVLPFILNAVSVYRFGSDRRQHSCPNCGHYFAYGERSAFYGGFAGLGSKGQTCPSCHSLLARARGPAVAALISRLMTHMGFLIYPLLYCYRVRLSLEQLMIILLLWCGLSIWVSHFAARASHLIVVGRRAAPGLPATRKG